MIKDEALPHLFFYPIKTLYIVKDFMFMFYIFLVIIHMRREDACVFFFSRKIFIYGLKIKKMIIISLFDNSTVENYFITEELIDRERIIGGDYNYFWKTGLYISPRDISIRTEKILEKNNGSIINGIRIYCDSYTRKRIFKIIENYNGEIIDQMFDYLLNLEQND